MGSMTHQTEVPVRGRTMEQFFRPVPLRRSLHARGYCCRIWSIMIVLTSRIRLRNNFHFRFLTVRRIHRNCSFACWPARAGSCNSGFQHLAQFWGWSCHKHPFCLDKLFGGVYCNGTMKSGQYSNFKKTEKLSRGCQDYRNRIFFVPCFAIGVIFVGLGKRIHPSWSIIGGVRFLKQRFGLPCPGCGWTHAGQAFFTGHILEAFWIQPAAGVFLLRCRLCCDFFLYIAPCLV